MNKKAPTPLLQKKPCTKQNPSSRRIFFTNIAKNIHHTLTDAPTSGTIGNAPYTISTQGIDKKHLFIVSAHKNQQKCWLTKGVVFTTEPDKIPHLIANISTLKQKHQLPENTNNHLILDVSNSPIPPARSLSGFSNIFLLTSTLPDKKHLINLPCPTLLILEADPSKPADDLLRLAPHLPQGSDVFAIPQGTLNQPPNSILAKRLNDFLKN